MHSNAMPSQLSSQADDNGEAIQAIEVQADDNGEGQADGIPEATVALCLRIFVSRSKACH